MKSEKAQREAEECTFKPHISNLKTFENSKGQYSYNLGASNLGMQSSMNSESIDKFLHRQQLARAQKEESKIYEEYIRQGGSASQDSYSWKAHKHKYL